MLSYRHGFHAGNFADVFKHAVVSLLLQALLKKDKPFVYLDTHSGSGQYYLKSGLARKNREHEGGIGRLWQARDVPAPLGPYLAAVRSFNRDDKLNYYPGSPRLAQHFLRPCDRMELCELHSSEVPELKSLFQGDRRVHVHHMDGYQGLKALLPPKERRGLVLCDPAYELKDERRTLLAAITDAWRRWPTGVYAIWYPILDGPQTEWLQRQFRRSGIQKILACDLRIYSEDFPDRLNGSGMIIINPPWQTDTQMETLGPWLQSLLSHQGEGSYRQEWLATE